MSVKRLRLFAGPNGSGKTGLVKDIGDAYRLGCYLNADEIEEELRNHYQLNLSPYCHNAPSIEAIYRFWESSQWTSLFTFPSRECTIKGKTFHTSEPIGSYFAAFLCDYLREHLLAEGQSFSFESVMSHPSKIQLLTKAQQNGYKTYLYFIATEDPQINIDRVTSRVKKGGHRVAPQKINDRYYRSLNLLPEAIKASYRAFLFDNSGDEREWIAEVDPYQQLTLITEEVPYWLYHYLLDRH